MQINDRRRTVLDAINNNNNNNNTQSTLKENPVFTATVNGITVTAPTAEGLVQLIAAMNTPAPATVPASGAKRVADNSGYCYKLINVLHKTTSKGFDVTEKAANWVDTEGVRYAADATATAAEKTASATVWTATKTVNGLSKLQTAAKAMADARRR